MKKAMERVKNFICPDWVYILLLAAYSMRHVHWGLDMLDTGYSYINFQHMDYEHMDSMWLFSTYLANGIGSIIMKLPFADTLLGQNIYTTLFVAALAIVGYMFCTRKLNMSKGITFLGEFIALSLCWCPSSVLYNYISYLLMLISVFFLYKGLVEEKKWYQFAAGICLGANVLTRFSNLAQAALILAVWAFGVLEHIECREKGALKRTLNRTLWCLGGYLAGLLPFLGYIHIKYGMDEYIMGISRLFGMTETATDYAPINMVITVFYNYYLNIYWVLKIVYYVLIGTVVWFVVDLMKKKIMSVQNNKTLQKVLDIIAGVASIMLAVTMIYNFYVDGLCNMDFYSYDSIRDPSILFMMLAMVIAFVKLLRKDVVLADKLIGIIIILIIFISSIGSNNGTYSSLNNLFLAAPYILWNVYEFVRDVKEIVIKKVSLSVVPVKAMLIAVLLFYGYQTVMFGYTYFYVEAEGAKNVTETVDGIPLLEGIKMSPERAEEITVAYEYVQEHGIQDRESIHVGHRPSIAYYLQLAPAFNSWPSLHSYHLDQMVLDVEELQGQINRGEVEPPVIIGATSYPDYDVDPKWTLLLEFMEENGYERTLEVGEFVFYEAR